jgi:imidazolonepropionase-like amidohydrolase
MSRTAVLIALATSPLTLAAQEPLPITAIRAGTLIDGTGAAPVKNAVILVQGDRITAVGAGVALPKGATLVDLSGATVLPGFIDAHVHLSQESGPNWYLDFYHDLMRFPAEQALYGAHYAKLTLEAGFTTVRDVGSSDYVALGMRNAISAGVIPGPRMLVSNYAIGSTGGHADQDPYPPERIAPAGPLKGVCNGPEQCREAARYQLKFGADVIKFMPSGGVLSLSDPVDNPQLTQEEMNAIVSEAHNWGRKVAAHCHGDRAAKMAIAAGVDSIEHGTFLKDDTLLEMKKKHVYLVATLFAGAWIGERLDTFPAPIAAKARAASAQSQTMFQHAVKLGTPIALGTDAAVEPHGLNAREFSLMAKNGLTPAQALMAGTAHGADLLGVADKVGTLSKGKLADVVAVAGNPLTDLKTTEHPVFVMREGVIYVGAASAH